LRAQGFDSPRIDYTNPDSIRIGLDSVLLETDGRLDALFNNGAHALNGAVEDIETDGLRELFEANFIGWHDLTRRVIPVMRARGHGHIIQCSSVLGRVSMRWRGPYAATKHALEALTDAMRIELDGSGIHVVIIQPGPITTDFRVKGIPYFEKWTKWESSPHKSMYEMQMRPRLYALQGNPYPFELPARAVSDKVVRALDSTRPYPRYFVTRATYIAAVLRRFLPDRVIDQVVKRI